MERKRFFYQFLSFIYKQNDVAEKSGIFSINEPDNEPISRQNPGCGPTNESLVLESDGHPIKSNSWIVRPAERLPI
jgi:hypothetical protein